MKSAMLPEWWGGYSVNEGATARWHIGDMHLWVQNGHREWRIASREESLAERSVELARPCERLPPDAPVQHRFGFSVPGTRIHLEPRLPDRPLVWRPAHPFSVPPAQEVTLYLRSPLWIGFRVDGVASLLWESPLRRLSDTWFGAPNEAGGYAYSADQEAVLDPASARPDNLHAVVPVLIRNSAESFLHVERIKLPMPNLSLFHGENGVWTQRITLERDAEDRQLALLQLGNGIPGEAGRGRPLAASRESAEKNLAFKAFNRIFQ